MQAVHPAIESLFETIEVKGLAHITGGGLTENIPRVLPETVCARLERARWPRQKIFEWLRTAAQLPTRGRANG